MNQGRPYESLAVLESERPSLPGNSPSGLVRVLGLASQASAPYRSAIRKPRFIEWMPSYFRNPILGQFRLNANLTMGERGLVELFSLGRCPAWSVAQLGTRAPPSRC
jgi:hypothetical protein